LDRRLQRTSERSDQQIALRRPSYGFASDRYRAGDISLLKLPDAGGGWQESDTAG
jgi:hypothetical protein